MDAESIEGIGSVSRFNLLLESLNEPENFFGSTSRRYNSELDQSEDNLFEGDYHQTDILVNSQQTISNNTVQGASENVSEITKKRYIKDKSKTSENNDSDDYATKLQKRKKQNRIAAQK